MDTTSVDRSSLKLAFLSYTRAAHDRLRLWLPEARPQVLAGLDEWRRVDEQAFLASEKVVPAWQVCLNEHGAELHALVEYRELVGELRRDPTIAAQVETLVGGHGGARRVEVAEVADRPLASILERGDPEVDLVAFEAAFDDLIADLYREQISVSVTAPLIGFNADALPLDLENCLKIVRLADEEIADLLAKGLISHPFGLSRYAVVGKPCAVRATFRVSKRVGEDHLDDELESARSEQEIASESVLEVIRGLRIFKEGQLTIPALLIEPRDWPIRGSTTWSSVSGGAGFPWFETYVLSGNEAGEFRLFWREMTASRQNRALGSAIRRLSYAAERGRHEDRIVDLMIAAESLFLTETGRHEEKTELRYRLALRAAVFVQHPPFAPRELFDFFRRLYDARSAVVHGGEIAPRLLKSPTGEEMSLDDFTQLGERMLRGAIRRAIRLFIETGRAAPLWEDLILARNE